MTGIEVATAKADRIVADVVAAESLEGWRPDDEQLAALRALASGTTSMTDYLSWCRGRFGDAEAPRRPTFARRQPYLIRGTSVLVNNLRLNTHDALQAAEFDLTAGRLVQAHIRPDPVGTNVYDLHRHVFADVYPWAGEIRITGIRKGGTTFARVDEIKARLDRLHLDVDEAFCCAPGYDDVALAYRLARIYADYNLIHPFREGNGRTGTLLLTLIARTGGRRLDLSAVTRTAWIDAARTGVADPTLAAFRTMFEAALGDFGDAG